MHSSPEETSEWLSVRTFLALILLYFCFIFALLNCILLLCGTIYLSDECLSEVVLADLNVF